MGEPAGKKYIFWIIAALGIFVLIMRITISMGTLRERVEKRLAYILKKEVHIGSLKATLPFNIALKNVKVLNTEDGRIFLEVKKVVLKYNPVDILLKKFSKVRFIQLTSPRLYIGSIIDDFSLIMGNNTIIFPRDIQAGIEDGAVIIGNSSLLLNELSGKLGINSNKIEFKDIRVKIFDIPVNVCGDVSYISKAPFLDISISAVSPDINGVIDLKGPADNSSITGWISLFTKPRLNLNGNLLLDKGLFKIKDLIVENLYLINLALDINKFDFLINISPYKNSLDNSINVTTGIEQLKKDILQSGESVEPGVKHFSAYAGINHADIFSYDVLVNAHLLGNIYFDKGNLVSVKGTLITRNTLIDFNPVAELNANFEYRNGVLRLERFSFGESFTADGIIDLKRPFDINVRVWLTDMELSDLVMFGSPKVRESLSGKLSGSMIIEGTLSRPKIKGRFHGKYGKIGFVDYETLNVNLQGDGPELKILDSQVLREKGYLMLDGFLNLRKLGRPRFLEGIRIRLSDNTVIWEGWNIAKEASEEEELILQKNIREDFRINFKKLISDEAYARDTSDDELELEYKMKNSNSLKMRLRDKEETLELQHKVKF